MSADINHQPAICKTRFVTDNGTGNTQVHLRIRGSINIGRKYLQQRIKSVQKTAVTVCFQNNRFLRNIKPISLVSQFAVFRQANHIRRGLSVGKRDSGRTLQTVSKQIDGIRVCITRPIIDHSFFINNKPTDPPFNGRWFGNNVR